MNLKLSVITPCYNHGRYINETIISVLNQNYRNVEHIIIDGGSNDNTVSILKSYNHLIWVSERDRGQADALNKGLAIATGDVIGWINSDDYYEANIFKSVMGCFSEPEIQWVIGDLSYYLDDNGEIFYKKSPAVSYERLLRNPDIVKQPPAFFRKSLLERAGGWNPNFYMVMDFDLWVRLAKINTPLMINEKWAYFRIHSEQKTHLSNSYRQLSEIVKVLKSENVPEKTIVYLYLLKHWQAFKCLLKSLLLKIGLLNKI